MGRHEVMGVGHEGGTQGQAHALMQIATAGQTMGTQMMAGFQALVSALTAAQSWRRDGSSTGGRDC